jgi:hypothetical protein
MTSASKNPTTAIEAIPELVALLAELSPEERKKALAAAMILIGDQMPAPHVQGNLPAGGVPAASEGISAKAANWITKSGLSMDQIENVFSIDADSVDVIAAELPAQNRKDQVVEAYLLCGLQTFLKTGESAFKDDDARALCGKFGCYDHTNHTKYLKGLGNFVSGSKSSGWKLTNPGLIAAAKIIRSSTATE